MTYEDSPPPPVPQTTRVVTTFNYERQERYQAKLPIVVTRTFEVFEDALMAYSKARRRRAYVDRPTSGSYRLELTALGYKVCREDPARRAVLLSGCGVEHAI